MGYLLQLILSKSRERARVNTNKTPNQTEFEFNYRSSNVIIVCLMFEKGGKVILYVDAKNDCLAKRLRRRLPILLPQDPPSLSRQAISIFNFLAPFVFVCTKLTRDVTFYTRLVTVVVAVVVVVK